MPDTKGFDTVVGNDWLKTWTQLFPINPANFDQMLTGFAGKDLLTGLWSQYNQGLLQIQEMVQQFSEQWLQLYGIPTREEVRRMNLQYFELSNRMDEIEHEFSAATEQKTAENRKLAEQVSALEKKIAENQKLAEKLATLEKKAAEGQKLAEQVAALEKKAAESHKLVEQVASLEKKVTESQKLSGQLSALEQKATENQKLAKQVAALQAEIDALKAKPAPKAPAAKATKETSPAEE
ncbi:MAG TPA: hypothetical protein VH186_15435 [Chloroflexia bacterium]|nr:hypothetical protein [Chloroflexia bacterium]